MATVALGVRGSTTAFPQPASEPTKANVTARRTDGRPPRNGENRGDQRDGLVEDDMPGRYTNPECFVLAAVDLRCEVEDR